MIQIGQRVYSGLYGGREGVVFAIHGEQRPDTVGSVFKGVICTGGNATFDIVFNNGTISPKLPETIIYGVQWEIRDEVVSADEIKQMLEFAASEKARKEAEQEVRNAKFSADVAALRSDPKYKAIQQTEPGSKVYSAKLAAINIRLELKAAFPGIKFSVSTHDYDEVRVKWMDGPLGSQVAAIIDKYQSGHFDGMQEIYEYSGSPWKTVFGDAKYVNQTRQHSVEALTKAVEVVCKDYGWPTVEVKTHSDGSAWVNLGSYDKDRILGDYLGRRHQYAEAA